MAGAGVKLFQDGIVLSAAEVNGYLMDQAVCVFDNPTQRDNAFGGANEPLLSSGRICFLQDSLGDGSNVKTIQFYNGSTWVDSSQFTTPDDSITNAKVSTTAAIALSKLASGTSGQIIVANASGVPTYVTLGGDATISTTGELTIGGNKVALGTDTTGNYLVDLSPGTGVAITHTPGEGSTATIAIGQSVATSASPTFAGITITGSASVAGNVVYNITTASVANSASISAASSGQFIETDLSSAGTLYVTGTGWAVGSQVTIMQMSASTSSASISFPGQTLRGTPLASSTVAVLRTQYSSATLINRGTNDWYVIGDLKA